MKKKHILMGVPAEAAAAGALGAEAVMLPAFGGTGGALLGTGIVVEPELDTAPAVGTPADHKTAQAYQKNQRILEVEIHHTDSKTMSIKELTREVLLASTAMTSWIKPSHSARPLLEWNAFSCQQLRITVCALTHR